MLLIIAIAWVYVVLMMSIAEHSVVAGIMTFLGYCVLPLAIVLYLLATPQRRRRRKEMLTGAINSQPAGSERSMPLSTPSSTPASASIPTDSDPEAAPGQQPRAPG